MQQQFLDLGVFDNRLPNCLILLFFADRLRQRHRQHVFDTAGVVDAHTFDLIRGQVFVDVLTIFRGENHVLHPRALLQSLVKHGRVVVVDEAFMDFVPGERESLASVRQPGLVVLRSLTKILAVPGLRVGYLLAEPELARRLRVARQAWPVNTMALVAARETTAERLAPIAARAHADRAALARALEAALPGATVHDGAANFVLVELPHGSDALDVATRLRAHDGIAIRPASSFPGLTSRHVRLTARGGETDARLVAALSRLA